MGASSDPVSSATPRRLYRQEGQLSADDLAELDQLLPDDVIAHHLRRLETGEGEPWSESSGRPPATYERSDDLSSRRSRRVSWDAAGALGSRKSLRSFDGLARQLGKARNLWREVVAAVVRVPDELEFGLHKTKP
jgi:hypothetical protein